MKLMTKKLAAELPKLYSQEHIKDPLVRVHYFNPGGVGDWYGIEFDGDQIFFGLCDIGFPELGYFSLGELQEYKSSSGLGIERDKFWVTKPLSEVQKDM